MQNGKDSSDDMDQKICYTYVLISEYWNGSCFLKQEKNGFRL